MQTNLGRRGLLFGVGAAVAAIASPAIVRAEGMSNSGVRRAALHNLHTGDRFNDVFYADGRYVPDALAEAMRVLRDWRNGEEHPMDPRLFDALHDVSTRLDVNGPFQVISGYRSPRTNSMLNARSSGVAKHSQHTLGKAIDVRIQGVELRRLRDAAIDVSAGGVGYYPRSNFVHVDVGRVRQWTGA